MSVVSANAARPIGSLSFVDIPGLEEVAASVSVAAGKVVVTFDAELIPEQIQAVLDRMTSRDDEDQAARAVLRKADGATNRWKLLRSYVLGDPMPDPIFPPPPE